MADEFYEQAGNAAMRTALLAYQERRESEPPPDNDAMLEAAVKWLRDQWGDNRQCPYCETAQWEVGTPLDIALDSGNVLTPHFPVMCSNCGNTVLINALRAGLLSDPQEDQP